MRDDPRTTKQADTIVKLMNRIGKQAYQRLKLACGIPRYVTINRLTKRQASDLIAAMIAETEK
ncbi:MAG: hypothetical protein KDJ52_15540 [Anaerolineae bacterium]|nr:hypothetical protein [Anaerolineae bacterium]